MRRFDLAASLARQGRTGPRARLPLGEHVARTFAGTSGGDDDEEEEKRKERPREESGGGGFFSKLKSEVGTGLDEVDTKEAEEFWGELKKQFGLASEKTAAAVDATKGAAAKAAAQASVAAEKAKHAAENAGKTKKSRPRTADADGDVDAEAFTSSTAKAEGADETDAAAPSADSIGDLGLLEWSKRRLSGAVESTSAAAKTSAEKVKAAADYSTAKAKDAAEGAAARARDAADATTGAATDAVGAEAIEEAKKAAAEAAKETSGFFDSLRKQLPAAFQKGEALSEAEVERLASVTEARKDNFREAVRNVFGLDGRAGRRAKPHVKQVDETKIAIRKAMEEAAKQDAEAAELEEKTLAEKEAADAVTARLVAEDGTVSVEEKMAAIAAAEKAAAELADIRERRKEAAKSNPALMVVEQEKSKWEQYKERLCVARPRPLSHRRWWRGLSSRAPRRDAPGRRAHPLDPLLHPPRLLPPGTRRPLQSRLRRTPRRCASAWRRPRWGRASPRRAGRWATPRRICASSGRRRRTRVRLFFILCALLFFSLLCAHLFFLLAPLPGFAVVYRAQAVFDIALEETERARAIREVQRLDPYFDVEDWLLAIEEVSFLVSTVTFYANLAHSLTRSP